MEPTAAPAPETLETAPRSGFGYTLMLIGIVLLAAELLTLSFAFDARTINFGDGTSAHFGAAFSHLGDAAKMLTVFAAVLLVLLRADALQFAVDTAARISALRFCIFTALNLAAFAALYLVSSIIFQIDDMQRQPNIAGYIVWLTLTGMTLGFGTLSLCRIRALLTFGRRHAVALGIASLVAVFAFIASLETQNLWGPLSDWTFAVSGALLAVINPEIFISVPEERLLGLGDFIVNVAPACSGYEGIGLITTFTALYLYTWRKELRFPHAFALFPIGAVVIWLLNAARIALLVAIGHYWSPEIAVGGFHSQAGWITFIATSVVILTLAVRSRFIQRERSKSLPINLEIACIVPLLALLCASLLTAAVSDGFDWLYPLRIPAVLAAIVFGWRHLRKLQFRLDTRVLLVGIGVAVGWTALLGDDAAYNAQFSARLDAAPFWLSSGWLLLRFFGSVVTVPIAEELAFRGYMLSAVSGGKLTLSGKCTWTIIGVAASSIVFGALHGAIAAGALAGLAYAWVRIRSDSVGAAITAHAITNALLFVYAVIVGNWYLL